MKKRMMMTALVLLVMAAGAQAQWRFGAKAGANWSKERISSDYWTPGYRLGGILGGMVCHDLNDYLSLQAELFYARRGFKEEVYADLNERAKKFDWNFSFHYINLPLLLKVYPFGQGGYVVAGPQIGYLIDSSNKLKGATLEGAADALQPDYDKFDYGVTLGLGGDVTRHLSVDARYYLGLTPVPKGLDDGYQNRSFEFTLGYWF